MPELPEVETVRRGLEGALVGKEIASVSLRRSGLRWPFPVRMAERLAGVTVLRIHRLGKYMLADLSGGETLIIHLGMSGGFSIAGVDDPHTHVSFRLRDGSRITYRDPRRFGMMDLESTDRINQHPLLASLGPEPLGNGFHGPYLHAQLKMRRSPVKSTLMNQRIVAGLGNIYVCESLWQAGISPLRRSDRIAAPRVQRLVECVRSVLHEAIAAGGSTLRDHRQPDGEFGCFQHDFSVYGRESETCRRPGCAGMVRRVIQSGRSTFYCGACQR
ncbi:MAG: bifunctional DNA-formamidopyrimidine glycosylase/DNA-(apurinic or apyrimidinic site) lyase [Rhodobacteraceae bacterium]|nr:bifunctional DNA-formamidopyrimidine glycosylase/DNA-(apurinic or apyrimidinic site) lyase [Paracoccaceae bacterium]